MQATSTSMAIQTLVPLSPETLGAAAKAARAAGQSLEHWLADAVELSYSVADGLLEAPWDRRSMELFAMVASESPGLLSGPWRDLYDAVAAESALWSPPPATLSEIEEGLVSLEAPIVDIRVLSRRWATLVAQVFAQ